MRMPSEKYLEHLRSVYPAGTRVKLLHMDDVQAPPHGTMGTVIAVDDMGSLIMKWDNGSGLNVVPEAGDVVEKADPVTTVCYGHTKEWDFRNEAEVYFMNAIGNSDGSEQQRYANIYAKLVAGEKVCSDD